MNANLIYEYCEVLADRSFNGHRAIYYLEDGIGYVDTDITENGEMLSFSCDSMEEFEMILADLRNLE